MENISDPKPRKYISERKIKLRLKNLAKKIDKDYKSKCPVFIGILNGSFIFFADLIRELTIDCEVDFLKLSSYGDSKISSGHVTMLKELNAEIKGRDVIIVEDIVDTGLSLKFIRDLINRENPKSLRFATLLHKKDVSKLNFKIDYVGFEIPNEFVIGYGLDYAQKYRNLKSIYVF